MMTDIKQGFIITYFKTSAQSEELLRKTINILSKENYYLILATHSPISKDILEKCDFCFYEELNVVDKVDELYNIIIADARFLDKNNLITYCKNCHLFKIHNYNKTIRSEAL